MAPVVPQPHRGFSPQPSSSSSSSSPHLPESGNTELVETTTTTMTTTILKPQPLGKPVLMRKPSPGGTRSSSSETLEDTSASSSTSTSSKWESSQSNGSSPHSTLGRGDTLPFANENVGTIKQRNPAPGKTSVLPGDGSPSPFESPSSAAATYGGDPTDEVGYNKYATLTSPKVVSSGNSSLFSNTLNNAAAVAAASQAATSPSVVGTMARRGGAKGVAQIPLDASLSSTIRRHSGLYPSSDEEGSAGLIPTSYRQFIPAATSTTSVVTTASGSSDSDTSSSISSTGTVQRRPHLPASSLTAKEDSSGERTPEREPALAAASSFSSKSPGASEQFKQPPPPPPAKPERQQQQHCSAPAEGEPAPADEATTEPGTGSARNLSTSADLNDIVDSTNVLNDIGNMLAGLTEELDAMLDVSIEEDVADKKMPREGSGEVRETVIT